MKAALQINRFWRKVEHGRVDACWPIRSSIGTSRYGVVWFDGKSQKAHRVAWKLAWKDDPGELSVLHSCDNPPCVNPAHLFLGNQATNMRDMAQKKRANPCRGSSNGNSKLSGAQIREIQEQLSSGLLLREVADLHHISISQAHRIRHRLTWKHL